MTSPKTPESGKKDPKAKGSANKSGKASGKTAGKAATPAADEDKAAAEAEAKEPEKTEKAKPPKKDKNKDILFIRHKLQRGFLSRDSPPKDEEMDFMANLFSTLEKNTDLEVSIIRNTRINKVLKMIVKLPHIPRDDEYQFRRRAVNILAKWKDVLGPEESKAKTNGVHKGDDKETPAKEDEREGEAVAEPTPEKPAASKDAEAPKEAEASKGTEVKEPEPEVPKEESKGEETERTTEAAA